MKVRKLEKKDYKEVRDIFEKNWEDGFINNILEKLSIFLKKKAQDDLTFWVLESQEKILAVVAFRKLPTHMKKYQTKNKTLELYVVAVDKKRKGFGSVLLTKTLELLKKQSVQEVIFFSGTSHKDSWNFHDKYAERIAQEKAPNGERGYIWKALL